MARRVTLGIFAGAVVIGAAALSNQKSRPGAGFATPTECLTAMVAAARVGDGLAYAACFAEPLRSQFEMRRQGDERAFADYLKAGTADLKGVATSQPDAPTGGENQLVLERIYSEHVEMQSVTLRRDGAGWKIITLGPITRRLPDTRYGTPVTSAHARTEWAGRVTAVPEKHSRD